MIGNKKGDSGSKNNFTGVTSNLILNPYPSRFHKKDNYFFNFIYTMYIHFPTKSIIRNH